MLEKCFEKIWNTQNTKWKSFFWVISSSTNLDVSQQIWKSDKYLLLLPTPNDGRALLTRQFWKPIQSCIGDSWPPIYHNQKLQDNNNESMRKMLNRLTNWRKNSSHWYSEKKILDEIMIIFYTTITYK